MIKKSKTFKKLHSRSAWLVITFWEYSTLAKEQEVDLTVMLLNFEKAYDMISWEFLEEVMEALGFEQK